MTMSTLTRNLFLVIASAAMFAADSRAQSTVDGRWLGKRVTTRYGAVLRLGDRVVDDGGRASEARASGQDRRAVRVFQVKSVQAGWLWLVEESGGVSGWARESEVQIVGMPSGGSSPGEMTGSRVFLERGIASLNAGDHAAAIDALTSAVMLDPEDPVAYNNRGNAWLAAREAARALDDYSKAVRLDPRYAAAYFNRGNAWYSQLRDDLAVADFTEAIRIDPTLAPAYHNRGIAWLMLNQFERAIDDLTEAARLQPNAARAYRTLALLLATCPDSRYRDANRAVGLAARACVLSGWDDPEALIVLAAACSEAGDEPAARRWRARAEAAINNRGPARLADIGPEIH
jgi:tetratricopeptide (TPR) repeat protein